MKTIARILIHNNYSDAYIEAYLYGMFKYKHSMDDVVETINKIRETL